MIRSTGTINGGYTLRVPVLDGQARFASETRVTVTRETETVSPPSVFHCPDAADGSGGTRVPVIAVETLALNHAGPHALGVLHVGDFGE